MSTAIADASLSTLGTRHPEQGPLSPVREAAWPQAAFPLGAHKGARTTTFAVYSAAATRVLLEIYAEPMNAPARCEYWMARGQDGIWRAELDGVPMGTCYGYRCWGPNWDFSEAWNRGNSAAGFVCDVDGAGHRFNPNKMLFDPYARELSHDRETPDMILKFGQHAGMYGSGPGTYAGVGDKLAPVVRREFDTGPWAPKSLVIADQTSFGTKPRVAQKDALIYETHLRGLTMHPSSGRLKKILKGLPGFEGVADVPPELRGTYAGAAHMARYLKALGYTAVEFLPVHEFANDVNPAETPSDWDRAPQEPPHGNYWGYMTYGFFAPDLHYAHDKRPGGPTREFKRMVKAFHDEGLEVYLDVVYNHTGEGGLWDGTGDTAELLFFRGYDNAAYYALTDDKRFYWDSTGCGNNLDAAKEPVQKFILDSLRYWSLEMGVDGFRFDLATVLGRDGANHSFDAHGALLRDIADCAEQEQIEIIAEAWDLDDYNVGQFPQGWAEWNGPYRDALRRFLKGDGNAPAFVNAVNGDYQRFNDQGGPHKSINFLTAHDGFTLMDLVSYDGKDNDQPWPFGPSDGGSDDNLSWDSGGDQGLRRQRLRSFLAAQFFSRGVPMTLGGDEFARTQNGNNNPYKIDSIGMWLNYDMIATPAPDEAPVGGSSAYHDNYGRDANPTGKNGLFLFLRYLLALRKAHVCLRQDRFGDFNLDSGDDVTYFFKREDGVTDLAEGDRAVHWHIDGSEVGDFDFLLCVNMRAEDATFTLPPAEGGRGWRRIIDTAEWAEAHGNFWTLAEADTMQGAYVVHPYSLLVLQEA